MISSENIFDLNEKFGEYQFSPLMVLIYNEDYENAEILLKEITIDVNIRDKYNNTPFIYMLKYLKVNGKVYELLISHGAFIDYELFENYKFMEQIIKNPLFLKIFVINKFKIKYNQEIREILNPLEFFIHLKNNKINQYFNINNDENILSIDNDNNNNVVDDVNDVDDDNDDDADDKFKLHQENKNDNNNNVEIKNNTLTFNENYDKNIFNKNDDTIEIIYPEFHLACIKGNEMMINMFIESEIYNLNQQSGDYKFSPLMILIINENYESAEILLRKTINVNLHDKFNNTPFIY
eukprot:jgi/Orpsp1_1/1176394/evm.model.c7180000057442.1